MSPKNVSAVSINVSAISINVSASKSDAETFFNMKTQKRFWAAYNHINNNFTLLGHIKRNCANYILVSDIYIYIYIYISYYHIIYSSKYK